jgi:glycerol-3-phosphate acyltransferase PlsY
MVPLLIIAGAYLLGSIPFGYLLVRLRWGADIRETGSGGTGATNVSRRAGKATGVVTLLLDAAKGATAVALAMKMQGSGLPANWVVAAAAMAVIVGHCFPIWLRFRGGKGVATGVGVFLLLAPLAVFVTAIMFLLVVGVTRYVSLGSIIAAAFIPVLIVLQNVFIRPVAGFESVLSAATAGALLIIFMHRANVRRLWNGTESKFK